MPGLLPELGTARYPSGWERSIGCGPVPKSTVRCCLTARHQLPREPERGQLHVLVNPLSGQPASASVYQMPGIRR